MKRIILLLVFLGLGLNLSSQEHKKWTVSLSENCGQVDRDFIDFRYKNINSFQNITLVPSIRYNFTPYISLGLSALLPIVIEKDEYAPSYTTGGELYVKGALEVLPNLKLLLSAVGMVGITGPYKVLKEDIRWECALPPDSPYHGMCKTPDIEYQTYRWLVGLRPSISYNFNPNWSLELGYGFLGYRSNKRLSATTIIDGVKPKGAWGFNSEMGWGNGLNIGIGYSF